MRAIGFRVDAAAHIGTGHLHRCITLACELKNLSIRCVFFVRQFECDLLGVILDNNFEYVIIGQSVGYRFNDDHTQWLGVSQKQDAQNFIEVATNYDLTLLVIDHYSIDSIWESNVKEKLALPILVIDDLANREHNCEMLLDQNYWPDMSQRYIGLTSDSCQYFLGPKYALLKPVFNKLIQGNMLFKQPNDSILVNFGGVGNYKLWQVVLPALIKCNTFNFHVVTGKLPSDEYTYLSNWVESSSHIYIEEITNKMPELMSVSVYSLGACGSTVWERFCLGLNSALIDVADNQKELVKYLDYQGLIDYLGSLQTITTEGTINFISNLRLDSECYVARKSQIQALVDGLGSKRIASHIIKIID
ncbi:UDP-2,4-diacetamido-2,4,6-trideoxy-beta-L-altropyranose hydrolase [Psychrobacter okhotskensis]|uniref:UDP-2,4-diacetamido-2,4, 6-trideoxy-beta-L-altropyranose hydrolase n=1 Tax=Psychrobacter okhotskensis TaxID=212403 RepID=UPI001919995D|nr:UDP-2,4-diacetamido-2,4,6-trideoxy-beta-L-altropyranose hydrolase [Psychrobacter okhotskensis]